MLKSLLYSVFLFIAFSGYSQTPAINSFSPSSGSVGAIVTLSGSNFNIFAANDVVFFGTVRATVTSGSASSLSVSVPVGATYGSITVLNTLNGLTGSSANAFTPTFTVNNTVKTPVFEPAFSVGKGVSAVAATTGDIDGDGKLDIVFVNSGTNTISVLRGTPVAGMLNEGSFTTKVDFSVGKNPASVMLYDMDGDGKLDIIVNNANDNTISVLHNISLPGSITTSSFEAKVDLTTGTTQGSFCVADIDGDGKRDIFVANKSGNTISFLRNINSQGSINASGFSKTEIPTLTTPNFIAVDDIDGDGKPDLVVTSALFGSENILYYYRNVTGNGSSGIFAAYTSYSLGVGIKPQGIALIDIDGDNKKELLVSTNYGLNIFQNIAVSGVLDASSFSAPVNYISAPGGSMQAGDIDGDGKADLFIGNGENTGPYLMVNASVKGYINITSLAAPVYINQNGIAMAIADIDGDGKADILVNNTTASTAYVLRNAMSDSPPIITGFSPVAGAVGSTVVITGSGFNTDARNNVVTFGSVNAVVTSASATRLMATVPAGTVYRPISVTNTAVLLTAIAAAPFVTTFKGKSSISVLDFAAKASLPAADVYTSSANQIELTDLDGDGKTDVLMMDNNTMLYIYPNNSSSGALTQGSFGTRIDVPVASTSPIVSITTADMNGDGKPDVILGYNEGRILVILNNSSPGNFSFGSNAKFGGSSYFGSIATTDANLDGKPDIGNLDVSGMGILTKLNLKYSYLYTSYSRQNSDFFNNPSSLAFSDIDGDGRPDAVVTDYDRVSVLRNTSATSASIFPVRVSFATGTSTTPNNLSVADIDGDGKPDIVFTRGINTVVILRNTSTNGIISSNSFAAPVTYTIGANAGYLNIADMNGDGKADIVIYSSDTKAINVLLNQATPGTIDASSLTLSTVITGIDGECLKVADIDGDGKPDLVIFNNTDKTIDIFRSNPTSATLQVKVSASKTAFSFSTNNPYTPIVVDAGITVTDTNNAKLTSGSASLGSSGLVNEDLLSLTTDAATMVDISAVFNPASGVLSMSSAAGATISQWQAAFRAVKYNNTNKDKPNLTDRALTFNLGDGALSSNTDSKIISLNWLNAKDASLKSLTTNRGH